MPGEEHPVHEEGEGKRSRREYEGSRYLEDFQIAPRFGGSPAADRGSSLCAIIAPLFPDRIVGG
jgi:hypothetical protein